MRVYKEKETGMIAKHVKGNGRFIYAMVINPGNSKFYAIGMRLKFNYWTEAFKRDYEKIDNYNDSSNLTTK